MGRIIEQLTALEASLRGDAGVADETKADFSRVSGALRAADLKGVDTRAGWEAFLAARLGLLKLQGDLPGRAAQLGLIIEYLEADTPPPPPSPPPPVPVPDPEPEPPPVVIPPPPPPGFPLPEGPAGGLTLAPRFEIATPDLITKHYKNGERIRSSELAPYDVVGITGRVNIDHYVNDLDNVQFINAEPNNPGRLVGGMWFSRCHYVTVGDIEIEALPTMILCMGGMSGQVNGRVRSYGTKFIKAPGQSAYNGMTFWFGGNGSVTWDVRAAEFSAPPAQHYFYPHNSSPDAHTSYFAEMALVQPGRNGIQIMNRATEGANNQPRGQGPILIQDVHIVGGGHKGGGGAFTLGGNGGTVHYKNCSVRDRIRAPGSSDMVLWDDRGHKFDGYANTHVILENVETMSPNLSTGFNSHFSNIRLLDFTHQDMSKLGRIERGVNIGAELR